MAAFAGASDVGASATANAATGAPTVSVTPTKVGSLIWGAGNDYDRAVVRTPSSGQAIVHQWLDTAIGDSLLGPEPHGADVEPRERGDQRHRADQRLLQPGRGGGHAVGVCAAAACPVGRRRFVMVGT